MSPRGPSSTEIPRHDYEAARLAAVREIEPFASEDDEAMVAIANEARNSCAAPIGLVSLMEETQERLLAVVGTERRFIPRGQSICARAILDPYVLVIPDLSQDPRFCFLPYVAGEPHLRFYAGAPILDVTGLPLGAVCVLHTRPHPISPECQRALAHLAEVASAVLETRLLMAQGGAPRGPEGTARAARSRLDALLVTMVEHRPSCA